MLGLRRPRRLMAQALFACAALACATASQAAAPRVERVVVIMRHGVRAPIVGGGSPGHPDRRALARPGRSRPST
ncbi:hypothetical protein ACRAWD_00925 [Caulobacter segnis]